MAKDMAQDRQQKSFSYIRPENMHWPLCPSYWSSYPPFALGYIVGYHCILWQRESVCPRTSDLEGTKGLVHLIACRMAGLSFPILTASPHCCNRLMQPRAQAKSRCTTWRCMHNQSMQTQTSQPAKPHVIVETPAYPFWVSQVPCLVLEKGPSWLWSQDPSGPENVGNPLSCTKSS